MNKKLGSFALILLITIYNRDLVEEEYKLN